jgi:hypothetical protein
VVIVTALALLMGVVIPARADSTRPAGLLGSDLVTLLADPAHSLEFIGTHYQGGGEGGKHLQAMDAAGDVVQTYDVGPTGGMAIVGSTLYVTDPMPDFQLVRLNLGVSPPGELTPMPVLRQLLSLVSAGGLLWGAECLYDSTVESIDPVTGGESPQDLSGLDISNCPQFADNPALAKIFYMWSQFHGTLYRVDTTGGVLTTTASWAGSINDVAVAPDGASVVVATSDGAIVLNPTTLAPTGVSCKNGSNISAVAVSGDGHVATATGNHVWAFPSGASTPNASWTVGGCLNGPVTARGLGVRALRPPALRGIEVVADASDPLAPDIGTGDIFVGDVDQSVGTDPRGHRNGERQPDHADELGLWTDDRRVRVGLLRQRRHLLGQRDDRRRRSVLVGRARRSGRLPLLRRTFRRHDRSNRSLRRRDGDRLQAPEHRLDLRPCPSPASG